MNHSVMVEAPVLGLPEWSDPGHISFLGTSLWHVWNLLSWNYSKRGDSSPNMGLQSKGRHHTHTCGLILLHLPSRLPLGGSKNASGTAMCTVSTLAAARLPCWHIVYPVLCLPEGNGVTSGLLRCERVSNVQLSL